MLLDRPRALQVDSQNRAPSKPSPSIRQHAFRGGSFTGHAGARPSHLRTPTLGLRDHGRNIITIILVNIAITILQTIIFEFEIIVHLLSIFFPKMWRDRKSKIMSK